jgi:hypothetical protein
MDLFEEYRNLATQSKLSPEDLDRMAEIMETAQCYDDLFEAIKNLDYLLAQEEGLLENDNLERYRYFRNRIGEFCC